MVKASKKEKDDGGGASSTEEQVAMRESKRLLELAMSQGLLCRNRANPAAPLRPSKRYRQKRAQEVEVPLLVSWFDGSPVWREVWGLKNLDSRNPTLYVDFPQGRLKLFGTIVYPKNKYLTMHFHPGKGDIVCEDCFESIVVFPEAWWIGTEEENPEELRLKMPLNLQEDKQVEVDFCGGAGQAANASTAATTAKVAAVKDDLVYSQQESPLETVNESLEASPIQVSSLRRSSRTPAEKIDNNFITLSGNSNESDDMSGDKEDKTENRASPMPAEDVILSQSSISDPVRTTGGSKSSLKQSTLTTFLTKPDAFQDSIDGVATEDLSQKEESGGTKEVSERSRRLSRKTYNEESEEESSEDREESRDSDPKSSGSRGGRGRERGRGARSGGSSKG